MFFSLAEYDLLRPRTRYDAFAHLGIRSSSLSRRSWELNSFLAIGKLSAYYFCESPHPFVIPCQVIVYRRYTLDAQVKIYRNKMAPSVLRTFRIWDTKTPKANPSNLAPRLTEETRGAHLLDHVINDPLYLEFEYARVLHLATISQVRLQDLVIGDDVYLN